MANPLTNGAPQTRAQDSDALVFFGATGDLAHKKIFPALQEMIRRGNQSIPVIGVAKQGWTLGACGGRPAGGGRRRMVRPGLSFVNASGRRRQPLLDGSRAGGGA